MITLQIMLLVSISLAGAAAGFWLAYRTVVKNAEWRIRDVI